MFYVNANIHALSFLYKASGAVHFMQSSILLLKLSSALFYIGDEEKNQTMATKHGSVCEFDSSVEDWTSYTERLQQYFAANDVAEGKQRAVLLSVCGCQTYQLVKNLLAPERPADRTFQEIVLLMKPSSRGRWRTYCRGFLVCVSTSMTSS